MVEVLDAHFRATTAVNRTTKRRIEIAVLRVRSEDRVPRARGNSCWPLNGAGPLPVYSAGCLPGSRLGETELYTFNCSNNNNNNDSDDDDNGNDSNDDRACWLSLATDGHETHVAADTTVVRSSTVINVRQSLRN